MRYWKVRMFSGHYFQRNSLPITIDQQTDIFGILRRGMKVEQLRHLKFLR
jgi:hypothetical protein